MCVQISANKVPNIVVPPISGSNEKAIIDGNVIFDLSRDVCFFLFLISFSYNDPIKNFSMAFKFGQMKSSILLSPQSKF